jgi:hypothetical protein
MRIHYSLILPQENTCAGNGPPVKIGPAFDVTRLFPEPD